jgi:hypothetical protein
MVGSVAWVLGDGKCIFWYNAVVLGFRAALNVSTMLTPNLLECAGAEVLKEKKSDLEMPILSAPIVAASTILGVMFLWLLWPLTTPLLATWAGAIEVGGEANGRTATIGAWGDSFGGFNALFAALGFGGVASTLYLQYRSHEREKVERHLSRFEDNFFRLIDLMRDLRNGLHFQCNEDAEKKNTHDEVLFLSDLFSAAKISNLNSKVGSVKISSGVGGEEEIDQIKKELRLGGDELFIVKGHDAIRLAYTEISRLIFKKSSGKIVRKRTISQQYDHSIRNKFEWCFSPYFRIIYTILRRISDDGVMDEKSKAYYANILRSQLTSYEVGLLAFNSTSDHSKDLYELLVEFRMLKYFPENKRKVLGNVFPEEAFAARD